MATFFSVLLLPAELLDECIASHADPPDGKTKSSTFIRTKSGRINSNTSSSTQNEVFDYIRSLIKKTGSILVEEGKSHITENYATSLFLTHGTA